MQTSDGEAARFVLDLVAADGWRMVALVHVRALALPDCWVGAGFVRNLVWDRLHGHAQATALDDIDVLYFDPSNRRRRTERGHEASLGRAGPEYPWSIRNQARMHERNGDPPYRDTTHAMGFWLETATAVAVRLDYDDRLRLTAPHGLDDLLGLRLRPTAAGRRRSEQYLFRVAAKNWLAIWPRLVYEAP
jgi:hypothetical protein